MAYPYGGFSAGELEHMFGGNRLHKVLPYGKLPGTWPPCRTDCSTSFAKAGEIGEDFT